MERINEMTMKTNFVIASFIAGMSSLAALATPAAAAPDLHIKLNLGLPRPPVVIVTERDHGRPEYRGEDREHRSEYAPRGYWKEIEVRRWVPGRRLVVRDACGRTSYVYEKGHYIHSTDRVWVEASRDHEHRYARR